MTRAIGFLIFENFQILDATGPLAAFEMPTRGPAPAPYALHVLAPSAGPVRSSAGISLVAEATRDAPRLDTLVVAGGEGTRVAMRDPTLRAFIVAQAPLLRRLCCVCSGAGIVAASGLLDGRRATTHWRVSAEFTRAFPKVRIEPDRIYVKDGKFWSSAGITAGIDLALALIAEDLGEAVAKRTAQELVVYYRRPGGQTQFSALLDMAQDKGRFARLLTFLRDHLAEPLPVERLAAEACMSPRHFARAFLRETGVTPAKAVEHLRLEVARERMEAGVASVEAVAEQTGFVDPERMRRAFLRAFGQPPQALRRQALRPRVDKRAAPP
jgi:transcriptional regulator GlxA family with amidase domain